MTSRSCTHARQIAFSLLLVGACTEQPEQASVHDAGDASVVSAQDAGPGEIEQDATLAMFDAALPVDAGVSSSADARTMSALDANMDVAQAYPEFDAGVQSTVRTSLLAPAHWQLLDAGEDPFKDGPAMIDCLAGAVVAEDLGGENVLGVDTGFCNYVTARQATLRAVAVGEVVKVRLWHFELSAPEPAEAHALVQIDGLRVLDDRIPIPSPGGLTVREMRVERAIAAGAPAYFHLHNHGANSWALVEVSAGPE